MKNQIPPITDPMGRHWTQPPRDAILIDDKHAVMTRETFGRLARYDCSVPSGVYNGKMWACIPERYDDRPAFLRWYDDSPDPSKCTIEHRAILFIQEPARD